MKCLFHHKEWDSDFILGFYVFTIFSLCQLFKMISTLDREDTNLKLCHEHLLHRVQLKFLDALILE